MVARAALMEEIVSAGTDLIAQRKPPTEVMLVNAPAGMGKSHFADRVQEVTEKKFQHRIKVVRIDYRIREIESTYHFLLDFVNTLQSVGVSTPRTSRTLKQIALVERVMSNEVVSSPKRWARFVNEAREVGREATTQVIVAGANAILPGSSELVEPTVSFLAQATQPVLQRATQRLANELYAVGTLKAPDCAIALDPLTRLAEDIAEDLEAATWQQAMMVVMDTLEVLQTRVESIIEFLIARSRLADVYWLMLGQGLTVDQHQGVLATVPGVVAFRDLDPLTVNEVRQISSAVWGEAVPNRVATRLRATCSGIPLILALALQGSDLEEWSGAEEVPTDWQADRRLGALRYYGEKLFDSLDEESLQVVALVGASGLSVDDDLIVETLNRLGILQIPSASARLLHSGRLHQAVQDLVGELLALPQQGPRRAVVHQAFAHWHDVVDSALRIERDAHLDAYAANRDAVVQRMSLMLVGAAMWDSAFQEGPSRTRLAVPMTLTVMALAADDRHSAQLLARVIELVCRFRWNFTPPERAIVSACSSLMAGELFLGPSPTFWHEYESAPADLHAIIKFGAGIGIGPEVLVQCRLLQTSARVRRDEPPATVATDVEAFRQLDSDHRQRWGSWASFVWITWLNGSSAGAELKSAVARDVAEVILSLESVNARWCLRLAQQQLAFPLSLRLELARKCLVEEPFNWSVVDGASDLLMEAGLAPEALDAVSMCISSNRTDWNAVYGGLFAAVCAGEWSQANRYGSMLSAPPLVDQVSRTFGLDRFNALKEMVSVLGGEQHARDSLETGRNSTSAVTDEIGDDVWAQIYRAVSNFALEGNSDTRDNLVSAARGLLTGSARDQLVAMVYLATVEASVSGLGVLDGLESRIVKLRESTTDGWTAMSPRAPEMTEISTSLLRSVGGVEDLAKWRSAMERLASPHGG